MSKLNILCTGGLGFIGRHLTRSLLEENQNVTVIDNLSNSKISDAAEIEKLGAKVLIEDIRRRKKAEKFDIVFHLAAQTSITNSINDPMSDASNNILGTIATIKNYPTSLFVYISSTSVYGECNKAKETDMPNPKSSYAFSKFAGELYVKQYAKKYLIPRLTNVFGPGSEGKSEGAVIDRFKTDKPIKVFGDGKQTRDFIHISEVINSFKILINANARGVFNVGTGENMQIYSLASKYGVLRHMEIEMEPAKKGEVINHSVDISQLSKVYKPKFIYP